MKPRKLTKFQGFEACRKNRNKAMTRKVAWSLTDERLTFHFWRRLSAMCVFIRHLF